MGSKHRADIAVAHVLIEKRRSLLEQLRAAIVQAQRIFAVCAIGIDRFGLVPNSLQQGVIVNVFQKLVDLRFRVADLRTLRNSVVSAFSSSVTLLMVIPPIILVTPLFPVREDMPLNDGGVFADFDFSAFLGCLRLGISHVG